MEGHSKRYDLEERTTKFSESILNLCKKVKRNEISRPIISQLVRSSTSVGANYCEANNASSKKDFRNKIFICKKEIQETKYWLRISANISPENKKEIKKNWKEAQELTMIFQKITTSLQKKE